MRSTPRLVVAGLAAHAWFAPALAAAADGTGGTGAGDGSGGALPAAAASVPEVGFVTLDRTDGASRVGLEVSYVTLDDAYETPQSALRFELHGQLVNPRTGLGVYESIPVSMLRSYDTKAAVGDVELGGLYARPLAPGLGLAVRAGATLPSSGSVDDAQVNALAYKSRPADSVQALDSTVTARLAGSLLYRRDWLVARADVGIDVALNGSGHHAVTRIDGGVGVDLGWAVVAAELTSFAQGPGGVDGVHTGAVSARARLGRLQPYAAVVIPIAAEARLNTSGALTLGLDVRLP